MANNKTLTEHKWFKWALWGPIATAVFFIVIIVIWDNSQQSLDWGLSSAHINDAIGRLKLPLAIASLAFPLVALVASHHRSVQTAAQIMRTDRQIQATEQKNAFENNIKHRETFKELLEKEEKLWRIKFHDANKLYENIFSQNDFRYFGFYADDMKRDVFYTSCTDEEEKVARNTCFVTPVLNELTLCLRLFRESSWQPYEENELLKVNELLKLIFNTLHEFDILVGSSDSRILEYAAEEDNEDLVVWHPTRIHPYMNQMFDFLGNSFVEIIHFSYSPEFRDNEQYKEMFCKFNYELSETRSTFRDVVYQYNRE
ncbi:hypothetical protein [Marinomonas shanghaiensis]|uniref:hypothetical protein n=1 Tax=Marinomonas shanghaiensis TaxID=2202418 RepID=UPI000DBA3F9A|nr:hypothetical protein [Marinomonas shanghaiensis]